MWKYGNWKSYSSVYFDHDIESSFTIACISSITDSPFESNVLNALAKENNLNIFKLLFMDVYLYKCYKDFSPLCKGQDLEAALLNRVFV